MDADFTQSNEAPWSASSLEHGTELLCRNCDGVLVKRGCIKTWRDLPSENWAEMMDFWHCHKPSDHGQNGSGGHAEHGVASKGYGANTKVMAQPGIGFVGLTYFLLGEDDCTGITVSSIQYLIQSLSTLPAAVLHIDGYQEGGQALRLLLDGLVTDTHAPNEIPVTILLRQQLVLSTLFFEVWVTCLAGGSQPRNFTPYLPQDLGRPWD
jgi:hypothetical protein